MDSEQFSTAAVPRRAPGDAGMGLFATSAINIGSDVCNLPATFSTVLDTERLQDTCSNCFSSTQFTIADPDLDLKFCSGCHVVKYCHKGCQAENWSAIHKYECAIYKQLHPRVLPINSRAVLRIVKLRASKKEDARLDVGMFETLRSHMKEISGSNKEQYERIMLCAKAEKEYSKTDLDLEVIAEYFAKDSASSLVGFDEGNIIIKAVKKIKANEQVFISYIDNTNPFETRQRELAERYFFTCKCSKCLRGDKAREDLFLTTSLTSVEMVVLKEAEKQALELLASAKKAEPRASVKQLKAAMRILHDTKMWPITRQPYVQIRSELIASLIDIESFWSALRHSAVRHLNIDPVVYPQKWHPLRNLHTYTLAKLVTMLRDKLAGKVPSNIKWRMDGVSIVYPLLATLNKHLEYELPVVASLYESDLEDMVAPVRAIGYDPSTESAAKAMAPHWKTLEKIAKETLEMDG
ncbi:histone methyltransferase SmyD1b [Arthroderma uncinatum]|uniref:histone methyltransferase SmyD1b n=1 Tax=Arthroderma uncinatum TaxID=74035 RepID=UPI00144A975F|nr:histone methyltransferase SmyD1b [Arthroderma uncinatum]KAF3482094.1 histone methyltransferase SmyD1b [Arthroderma uncinatum]